MFFAERTALELKICKQIIFSQVEVAVSDTPIFLASKDDSSVLYKEIRDLKINTVRGGGYCRHVS